MSTRLESCECRAEKDLPQKGLRALLVNVFFFLVLLGGMVALPFLGIKAVAGVVAFSFVFSFFYVYLT
jgi:hypothetical protein